MLFKVTQTDNTNTTKLHLWQPCRSVHPFRCPGAERARVQSAGAGPVWGESGSGAHGESGSRRGLVPEESVGPRGVRPSASSMGPASHHSRRPGVIVVVVVVAAVAVAAAVVVVELVVVGVVGVVVVGGGG